MKHACNPEKFLEAIKYGSYLNIWNVPFLEDNMENESSY